MFNIFETPALLIMVAGIAFVGLVLFSNMKSYWKVLIPLVIAGLGFGVDHFIKTDNEKINLLIDNARTAFVVRDFDTIDRIMSSDYKDSYHKSKDAALNHCKRVLDRPFAEKIKMMYSNLTINGNNAKTIIEATIHIDQRNPYAGMAPEVAMVKVEIDFAKTAKEWKVTQVELKELNKSSVSWGQIN